MGSSAGKTNRRRTPGNLGHDSLPLAGGAERYETIQFATRRFAGRAERYEPREGPSRERSSAGTRGGEPRETTCTPSNPDVPRGGAHPVAGARGAHAIFFQSTSVVIHPSPHKSSRIHPQSRTPLPRRSPWCSPVPCSTRSAARFSTAARPARLASASALSYSQFLLLW